jgi:hypothetical protein
MNPVSDYAEFLARKISAAPQLGRAINPSDTHPMLHPWQREIVAWAVRTGRAAIWADTGLGKAQPIDEPVLTPDGWRPMGELHVGDQVIAGDGTPTQITGVYPQGVRPLIEVEFNDGLTARCDTDHLWPTATDLQLSRGGAWKPRKAIDLIDDLRCPDGRAKWRVPVVGAVHHAAADLPIDPYVLGVLLGDGCIREHNITFTVEDCEIASEVKDRLPDALSLSIVAQVGDRTPAYRISGSGVRGQRNPVLDGLRDMRLMESRAIDKFIPDQYLRGSVEQRLDLLRGLMDTDGYASAHGTVQFGSSSHALADGVCALVRSLGGTVRRSAKYPTYTYKGERRTGMLHHTLTIALPSHVNPFALPRKVARFSRAKYAPQRKIVAIRDAGEAEAQCIAVAHPTHTYVTRDYIVTHNTVMQLEWARLTIGGDQLALIIAPLAVCQQTAREAAKLGITARYVRHQDEITHSGIWITNYEMADRFDPSQFAAVVLDEASILKSSDGKTRTKLISHFADVPARLACTATPAPNDPEELTNQAEFLGRSSRANMLAAYFVHDSDGWRPKGHARGPMFRWMASWALAIRRPSDLGYPDGGYQLPGLEIIPHLLPVDAVPDGQLFATELGGVGGRAAVRRETLTARCHAAAELVTAQPHEPWLLWCGLNDEADTLARLIPGAVNVHGSLSPEQKAELLLAFADGGIQHLITKPSIAGMGLNLQRCARMAFVGLSDSYETYYQSIRRCYRYGQTRVVQAHIVLSDLEAQIASNVARKEREAAAVTGALVAEMQRHRTLTPGGNP